MEKGDTLPLVRNREEICQNAATLHEYLNKTNSPECKYTKTLIRRGKCFVVVPDPDKSGYQFYPSRFMGYIGNSMAAHERMGEIRRRTGKTTRDGKKTNPVISRILGELIKKDNEQWDRWELEYQHFCKKLGISPDNIERKYWLPIM